LATDLQDVSRRLFAAADQLWTNTALRPDQYGQPVLALIALRQMEAKFTAVEAELAHNTKVASSQPLPTTKREGRSSYPTTLVFRGWWRCPARQTLGPN
jgi:hypothetical protein